MNEYVDITDIVQRLNKAYDCEMQGQKYMKVKICRSCKKLKSISQFKKLYNSGRNYYYHLHDCKECCDIENAHQGLIMAAASVLREICPYDKKEDMHTGPHGLTGRQRQIYWEVVTPEILKLKIILNKVKQKLQNYDAS